MQRITIDPITRLEGHGKIEIFLNEEGDVANTYFQIPELRGFERFCVGRPVEEMPLLTNRICGVCPEAHHMAGAKAADAVYHVDPPRTAKMLRELLYSGFYFTDHTTHFYALAGPDFVMGPDAPVAERNILGVIHKVGLEIRGKVIQARKYGHHIVEMTATQGTSGCADSGALLRYHQRAGAEIAEWAAGRSSLPVQPGFQRHRARQPGLRGPGPGRHLHPSHLLHGDGG
jgi:F420-non-reducing hydrogenase large subunit